MVLNRQGWEVIPERADKKDKIDNKIVGGTVEVTSDIESKRNRITDYIFMCFLLGNDFMPHFPALNIRTVGIDILLNVYRETLGKTNKYLTNGNKIMWKNFCDFFES